MKDILMPSFGADMAKGEVAEWKVKPGDAVRKGDIIASIETMKGLIDMEVFDDGVIETLLVPVGEELEVGRAIAKLRLANEESIADETKDNDIKKTKVPENEAPILDSSKAAANDAVRPRGEDISQHTAKRSIKQSSRKKISPLALKTAQKQGVDWQQLGTGSGPEGAIVLADITAVSPTNIGQSTDSANTFSAANITEAVKPSASDDMREAIAAVVSRSKREIPHYYLQLDVVLDKALEWLAEHNQALPPEERVLVNALIYTAIARALDTFSGFNGFYQNNAFTHAESVHLGNAISLRQGGLVVAAIHNAQQLNCTTMMLALRDQVVRAREGGLRMSEMQDATITVSNLGDRGVDSIQSIIFPPQVAIIGIGRMRSAPWVIEQQIEVVSIVNISLAADHRVSDGHSGARLLNKINKLLQNPRALA
ncbi:MAG: pyruvate dehydrogenase E2 component (dihydrolipoamide acetyltransferase) [Paraglaciecola sp.]|jgi:pyruvate dehydrogenase E2 component (dihydrolipoamide acetyltransferase)